METGGNKKGPYVCYWLEEEWTNGNYPKIERICGYDRERGEKEVMSEIRSESFEERQRIVAMAKSDSYLWYCCERGNGICEVRRMDLNGENEVLVAQGRLRGSVRKLWVNDTNAYILTGDGMYQINSNGNLHVLIEDVFTDYFCGRITEEIFLLCDSFRPDACVWVFENDALTYKEYVCDTNYAGKDGARYAELTWCVGIYDGKAAVIKSYGTEGAEVDCQVMYVLDREKKTWEEIVLWEKNGEPKETKTGNSVFAFTQTGEKELFAQSGPALTLFQEDNMGLFVYEVRTGIRRELCVTDGWCNAEGTHIVGRNGRYVYTCIWCDQGDGYMLTEVNLDTGEQKVLVKRKEEYLIAVGEEGKKG